MFSIFAPTRAKAANPSQTVMKEKPMKRPRVPPKSATFLNCHNNDLDIQKKIFPYCHISEKET